MIFEPHHHNSKSPSKKTILLICGAVVLLLVGALVTVIWKYNQKDSASAQAAEASKTSQRIIEKVGKIYQLPEGDDPTVALIQDKTKLGNQEFFSKVENGDYILVYSKDKMALVYREKENKLINVGPIALEGDKPTVAVLNGTGDNKRVVEALGKLKNLEGQVQLSGNTTDAKNKSTPQTIIVDVSGQNSAVVAQMAQVLGAKTESSVPANESVPANADVVLIVGQQ